MTHSLSSFERELAEIAERMIVLAKRMRQARMLDELADERPERAIDSFREPEMVDYGPRPGGDPDAGQPVQVQA